MNKLFVVYMFLGEVYNIVIDTKNFNCDSIECMKDIVNLKKEIRKAARIYGDLQILNMVRLPI